MPESKLNEEFRWYFIDYGFFSKIYVEAARNGVLLSDTMESTETPTNSQVINGFAVPHSVISDNESIALESQTGSIANSQVDEEMDQDNHENERDEEADEEDDEEEEEEEDKPSSSSSPTTNLTDENSSSSNSNSTPVPSSSTEDMIEQ